MVAQPILEPNGNRNPNRVINHSCERTLRKKQHNKNAERTLSAHADSLTFHKAAELTGVAAERGDLALLIVTTAMVHPLR